MIKSVKSGFHDSDLKNDTTEREDIELAERETFRKSVLLVLNALFAFFVFSFINDWSYLAFLALTCGSLEVIVNFKSLTLMKMIEKR